MNDRSEQLSEKLRKLEYPSESGRMFDEIAPCVDQGAGDANSELVDELENILRGEAGGSEDALDQEPHLPHHFPLAAAEPDEFDDGPALTPEETASFPIAEDPAGDFANSSAWADEFAADDDLDATDFDAEPGLPKTRYGSPTPKFWDGDDLTQGLEEEEASTPRFARPRDVVTVALLLALVGGGATFSAIQLTRDPVVVASTETTTSETLAVAEAPVEPETGVADAVTPEAPPANETGPNAIIPGVDAVDTVPDAVGPVEIAEGPLVANPPAEAVPEEPQIAELDRGPGPAPGGNDPGATVNRTPAAANAGSPVMAFADPGVGGPMRADPLAVLEAEGLAGNTTPAIANSWVNMRAGPDNDAAIITVVAEGAAVDIIECDGWCNVSVDGVEGWIYQSFLNVR